MVVFMLVVFAGRAERRRVTRLYTRAVYVRLQRTSSKSEEEGDIFFVDIRFEMEKGAFQGLLLFLYFSLFFSFLREKFELKGIRRGGSCRVGRGL